MESDKVLDELAAEVAEKETETSSIVAPLNEPLEEFPVDVLPGPFKSFVKEGAKALCCPPDFIAVPLLGFTGTAIGMTRQAVIKPGWTESPSLYLGIVGRPGTRKSPALELAQEPLNKIQSKYKRKYEQKKEEYEDEYIKYEKQLELYKKASKNGHEPGEKPKEPEKPILERVYTSDATVEALGALLEENPRGLALVRDELAGWVMSLNQYKGKGADRQFYLTVWSNKPFPIDRKGNEEPLWLEKPFLTVVGGIQPDMLNELSDEKGREDGFVHRILFTYPAEIPQSWSNAVVSDSTKDEVYNIFATLFGLKPGLNEHMESVPQAVPFTKEAQNSFIEWLNENSQQMQDPNFPDNLIGSWDKLPGQLARLALILQMSRWAAGEAENDYIDNVSLTGAAALIEYFKTHIRKVYKRLHEDATDKKCRKAIDWISKNGREGVTARDLQRYKVCSVKNAEQAKMLLDELVSRGMGDFFDIPQGGRGRKTKRFFLY